MRGKINGTYRRNGIRIGGVIAGLVFAAGTAVAGGQPASSSAAPAAGQAKGRLAYPTSRRSDQIDVYHGERVADPYRWLEDPASAETGSWIEAQNALTYGFLEKIPQRDAIRHRLTELWNYEKVGLPVERGGRYFYTRNDGLQNQPVLYVADSLEAEPRVLLDPNTLLADGTAALAGWSPSEDGRLVAYGISEAGSDWVQWKVRDVATGTDRSDLLKWVKFSSAGWLKDGSGFFYARFDEPSADKTYTAVNPAHKIYFHRLGDPQSNDKLIHQIDRPGWLIYSTVTDDGRYLVLSEVNGVVQERVFYRDLSQPDAPTVTLISGNGKGAGYEYVGNEGGRFWFKTDDEAAMGRLVEVDIARPDRANWKTLIPEGSEALQGVSLAGDSLFASYLHHASSRIRRFGLDGTSQSDVRVPVLSSLAGFSGRREDTEAFYAVTNFLTPPSIYRYDLRTGQSRLFHEPKLPFDPAQFETKQVFATSKDGTKVPVFLTHRRGLKLDGTNPALMTGYGGFKISRSPGFSPETIAFVEKGGVFALVIMRGGDEYGEPWHQAGMRARKQNVFDDFIGAAQWLIDNRYTQPRKLAIRGGSNAGLLVGAVMTQRPELFGAALPAVGVLDMLRFQNFTIGRAWSAEYGSSDDPEAFRSLRAYSPLHNLRPGTKYPPTLVTTGDHDDRVAPAHSYKFAAALQHAQGGEAPVLIRIETRTGHGQGRPTSKQIELAADQLAFLHHALDMEE